MSVDRRSRGFSLLEAVAALALLGLALPVILSTFSDAIAHAARAEDRLDTLRRAQDLVVLATTRVPGEGGMRSGSDVDLSWTIDTTPLSDHDGATREGPANTIPMQVAVVVRSRRGAEVRLDTVFLSRRTIQ